MDTETIMWQSAQLANYYDIIDYRAPRPHREVKEG